VKRVSPFFGVSGFQCGFSAAVDLQSIARKSESAVEPGLLFGLPVVKLLYNYCSRRDLMTKAAIRKLGGSHFVVVPPAFLKQAGLSAGSTVDVSVRGDTLTVKPDKAPSLEELVKATPKKARVPGWDEMPAIGGEW
jgi:antitoxin component of MazEF toxin-antitoxin module